MARYAVVGIGRFGRTLAELLAAGGEEVIVIDRAGDPVEDMKDKVALAVVMDATDEEALKEQGVHNVDVLVAAMGENFEANQLVTLIAKKHGVPKVIARVRTALQAQIMSLIGADEVICPEEETARRLAQRLTHPHVMAHLELADKHSLVELRPPRGFVGKSIRDLDIRRRFHVNLVAVKRVRQLDDGRTHEEVNDVPSPDYVIQAEDVLVVVGRDDDLAKLDRT